MAAAPPLRPPLRRLCGRSWAKRVQLVLSIGADDAATGLGNLVPCSLEVAQWLRNDQPRLIA
jgi:hypothetical protein